MPERCSIGVSTSEVVILTTDEVTVIGCVPATMSSSSAKECAQRIFDEGMLNKEEHYDRHCCDDYDILTFFEEQLEKHGFTVIDTRTWSCDQG